MQDDYVAASVSALHLWRGPSAVVGSVAKVSVDPVNAVPGRRTRPHVGIKHPEIFPLRSDSDPSASVKHVTRVAASFPHSHPDFVFWAALHAVNKLPISGPLAVVASAAFSVASCQGVASDNQFVAAVTTAEPTGFDAAACGDLVLASA
jgi:hypothetical protein